MWSRASGPYLRKNLVLMSKRIFVIDICNKNRDLRKPKDQILKLTVGYVLQWKLVHIRIFKKPR